MIMPVKTAVLALLAALLLSARLGDAQELYRDNFDGASLDVTRWVTDFGTSGPRFQSSDGGLTGQWVSPGVTAADYGIVRVENSILVLGAPNGSRVYPYVFTRTSPFPASGDFVLEFALRWEHKGGGGGGSHFVVRFSPDNTPQGTNSPFSDVVLELQQTAGGFTGQLVNQQLIFQPANQLIPGWQAFRLEYVAGAYRLLGKDGTPIAGPVASPVRANTIWIGNPVLSELPVDIVTIAVGYLAVSRPGTSAVNHPPNAYAGPDQSMMPGDTVLLDGSWSQDDDGDSMTYRWSIVSIPLGSTANLSLTSIAVPVGPATRTFTVDLPGTYVFELVVNDGVADSAPSRVTVSTMDDVYHEDFAAATLEPAKWDTSIALTPPRFRSGDPAFVVGEWLDPGFAVADYGTITTGGGRLIFANNPGKAVFPYVTTVASPFPAQGSLVMDFVVGWDANGFSNGASLFTLRQSQDNSPVGTNSPFTNVVLRLQNDIFGFTGVLLDIPFVMHHQMLPGTFNFRFRIDEKTWPLPSTRVSFGFVGDLSRVVEGTLTPLLRPNTVWMGNPLTIANTFLAFVDFVTMSAGPIRVFSSQGKGGVPTNLAPVANAGPDQSVAVGTVVTLDGTASSDPDGNPLTYQWTIISKPAGSVATLSDPSLPNPTFTVDIAGQYTFQLVVNDGLALSAPDNVTVSTVNSAPVADAGPDQTAALGASVTLDGTKSFDVDGDPLTYQWTLTKPAGSTAVLSDPIASQPIFTIDVAGSYTATLVVSDGTASSKPDNVLVNTSNSPPVANPGPNQSVNIGTTVTLDGSGSSDPDGDPLTYAWSLLSKPGSSTATLTNATSVMTSFVVDVAGPYTVQLTVGDGTLTSTATTMVIGVDPRVTLSTLIQQIITTINGVPPTAFKNANMARALTNKLEAVRRNVQAGNYADALNQVENDLIPKTDGCATGGAPDNNDFITDCTAQNQIYPQLVDLRDQLSALVNP